MKTYRLKTTVETATETKDYDIKGLSADKVNKLKQSFRVHALRGSTTTHKVTDE